MDLLGLLVATLVATLGFLPEVNARTVGDFLSLRLKIQNGLLTLLLLAGWFQVFQVLDLYEERVWSNPLDSIGRLTLAAGSTVVLFTLVALVFHIPMATPLFVAIFGAISLLFLVGDRVLLARIVAPIFSRGTRSTSYSLWEVADVRQRLNRALRLKLEPILGSSGSSMSIGKGSMK